MIIRSMLLLPGIGVDLKVEAETTDADTIFLDLEVLVKSADLPDARNNIRDFLKKRNEKPYVFVRVNELGSEHVDADLEGIMPGGPDGIILPKSEGGASVKLLADKLRALEERNDLPLESTRILALAMESPSAIFDLQSYVGASERLDGLSWGGEDLRVGLGAKVKSLDDGTFTEPFQLARLLTLYAGAAEGVNVYETIFRSTEDSEGLKAYAERAARDGFAGMVSIGPTQTPIINTAFSPSEDEIERARYVVSIFDSNPGESIIYLEDEIIDPHQYESAKKTLSFIEGLKS